jgi:hypothetical protein
MTARMMSGPTVAPMGGAMNKRGLLLDELRVRYEAVQEPADDRGDVESFQAIDARLRKAFRWLENAITYLNGLKPRSTTGSTSAMATYSIRRGSPTVRSVSTSAASSAFRCSKGSTSTTRFRQPSLCR